MTQFLVVRPLRAMSFKITPSPVRILDPFAIFCAIWGIVSMVGLPLFQVFVPLSKSTRMTVLLATVFIAAFAASAYSVRYACRVRPDLPWIDRAFYFIFYPVVFFTIFGFGLYLSI